MIYAYKTMESPIGELKLVASGKGLAAILWENDNPKRVRLTPQILKNENPFLSQQNGMILSAVHVVPKRRRQRGRNDRKIDD